MAENEKIKGTFAQRFFIVILAVILGVSFFWLLGFITSDIGSIPGPVFSEIESKHIDPELRDLKVSLKKNLENITKNINNQTQKRRILKDSTENLQTTINQLLAIQKQNVEQNRAFPEQSQKILSETQTLFLKKQSQYQKITQNISELTNQKQSIEKNLKSASKQIEKLRKPAWDQYHQLRNRHRLKIAFFKLLVLLPIFVIATWLFIKKRSTKFGPVIYAGFIAVFAKIALVAHQYFPRKYFKYIAMLVIIAVILKLLIYFIKRMINPKKNWLVKQYRQAYDKYRCPICGKPIRIGPLRYAVFGKQKKHFHANQNSKIPQQQPYTCPSCGTELYQKCQNCSQIRHSLLPFCEHCGDTKQIS